MKRIIFIIIVLMFSNVCQAKDIPVNVKPANIITTSNLLLQEGDSLDFVVLENVYVNSKLYLKKGEKVSGCVTQIQPNGFLCEPATIYIENFTTKNAKGERIKLKGIVYKKGNDHHIFTEFFFFNVLRGGEVQIKPEKDEFMIYVEENL